jgi:hypothetical protein
VSICFAFAGAGYSFKESRPLSPQYLYFGISSFKWMAFTRNSSVEVAPTSTPGPVWHWPEFLLPLFGVGYEAACYDNGGTTAHMPSAGNFFLRYPICTWHLAPYAMVGGGGGTWNPDGIGYGNVARTAEEATDRGIVLADFPRVSMEKQSGGVSANWKLAMEYATHGEPQ